MNNTCLNCKHYQSSWDYVGDKFTKISQECKVGNTTRMEKWWIENGKKLKSEITDNNLKCFEDYDSVKKLDSLIEDIRELSDKLTTKPFVKKK